MTYPKSMRLVRGSLDLTAVFCLQSPVRFFTVPSLQMLSVMQEMTSVAEPSLHKSLKKHRQKVSVDSDSALLFLWINSGLNLCKQQREEAARAVPAEAVCLCPVLDLTEAQGPPPRGVWMDG